MTQHPYGSDELDRMDPELDGVALELERYAAARSADAPAGLAAIVKDAIADEPAPVIGWWHRLLAGPVAWGATGRSIAVAAVVMLLLVGSVAVGQLLDVSPAERGQLPVPDRSPRASGRRRASRHPRRLRRARRHRSRRHRARHRRRRQPRRATTMAAMAGAGGDARSRATTTTAVPAVAEATRRPSRPRTTTAAAVAAETTTEAQPSGMPVSDPGVVVGAIRIAAAEEEHAIPLRIADERRAPARRRPGSRREELRRI